MDSAITLAEGKKAYFISDMHLGMPDAKRSLEKEKKIVRWLCEIQDQCGVLMLCGDVFDFWYEWKHVVPKGYVRLLAKIAELADAGIPVYFFTGNHDMWVKDYFEKELGITVLQDPCDFTINGKMFFIGHGDGLGPNDRKFKTMKLVFKNKVARWAFSHLIHPDWAISLANYFSRSSRAATKMQESTYLGDENEWLYVYCNERLRVKKYDYFVFGHRHLVIDRELDGGSRYINLGDWLSFYSYGEFDGDAFFMRKY